MADDPQAEQKVEDPQPEPTPSSEQRAPDTKEAEAASPQGEGDSQPDDLKLPDDVKQRTSEQFDKLKSQLAEERDKRLRYERMFNQMSPAEQRQERRENPEWFDPETGNVDVNTLDNQFQTMRQQLDQANRTIQGFVSREDERQAKAAYKAHPQLDPNRDDFNEDFHKAVVGYLANAYAEGKNPTMKQAADTIRGFGTSEVKKAEKEGAKKALEQLSPKEQAALEAESRSDKRNAGDLETLRERTRRGDETALLERLKSLPPVGR